nr:MAG TPA: hypothetical protein [Caudoviricetes sp.]
MVTVDEKANEEMPNMMNETFNVEVNIDTDKIKECAVIGLIKNQKIVLEDELREAKLRYADVALEEENWSGKYERKTACKIIEGQIAILTKLQQDFKCMLTPEMTPN